VQNGNVPAIKSLLETKQSLIDINEPFHGSTALFLACENEDYPVVSLLLVAYPNQIDINFQNERGVTPLAAAIKNPEIVKLLLKQEAINPNLADYLDGKTAFASACSSYVQESVSLMLACEKVDVNKRDKAELHPIFYSSSQDIDMTKLLSSNSRISLSEKGDNVMKSSTSLFSLSLSEFCFFTFD